MISVKHLTKCYGEFTAVDDLSFEIDEGHVYGFLGPNGAGKSTTMNIITGCLSATSGQVTIDGHDIFEEPKEAKRAIGYLPEIPPLYTNETPEEYLKFVAEAKGLKGKEMDRQIEGVISQTRIQNVRKRLISKLSKGYRQRVGIAQALLGNPKVIILDEPTVGLDPIQIIEIRDLIKQLGKNHTVILSSHILSEVQAICEKVLIISDGKLIAFDEPEHLEKSLAGSNEILFTTEATREEVEEVKSLLGEITEVSYRETQDGLLSVTMKTDSDDIRGISRKLGTYVTYNTTDEELAKYGLDEPQYNLEVKYTPKSEDSSEDSGDSTDSKAGSSEKTFILHVSAKQDDKAYVRIGDSKIIYEITEDEYKNVTDGSYDSLRHKSVVTANLSDVDSVKVTLEDKDYTIDLSEKKGDVVSTYDGEEIEGTDFTDALKALKASDFTSEEPSEKEEISFTLHYKDDKYPEKEVKIYRYDGTNCLVTIDGKSISLVKRDLVVDLMEAVNAIVLK